jgi:hypothetical protein
VTAGPFTAHPPQGLDRVLGGAVGAAAPAQVLAPGPQLAQIEAGAERRVGAGEDDGVDVLVELGGPEGGRRRPVQRGVQRVAGLGPVQGDRADPVGDDDPDQVGVHGVGRHGGVGLPAPGVRPPAVVGLLAAGVELALLGLLRHERLRDDGGRDPRA